MIVTARGNALDDGDRDREIAARCGEPGGPDRKAGDHEHADLESRDRNDQIPTAGDARARVVHEADRGMEPRSAKARQDTDARESHCTMSARRPARGKASAM